MMIATTGFVLAIRRFRNGALVKWVLRGAIGLSIFSTSYSLTWEALGDPTAFIASAASALLLILALSKWPRWYVINFVALVLGAVTTAVLGISMAPPLVAVLLLLLSIYDAIAVYKTRHMLGLAEVILNSGLPLVLIIPKQGEYIDNQKVIIQKGSAQGERRAFYMGLGDLIIPGCLVVSVYSVIGISAWPVISIIVLGTLLGFTLLATYVAKGNPQAGLPFLCGGAILGYLISSFLFYGKIVGLF
jgi:presenilin-like A22 family membrane protease